MTQSWEVFRGQIAAEFAAHPQDFLRQTVIGRTLHPHQPELALRYRRELRLSHFGLALLAAAPDAEFGSPHVNELTGCSMVATQHAWQILQMRERMGLLPTDLEVIAEIGGGYGDMCRQMRAAGFAGLYCIYDFAELRAIQRAYLEAVGVDCLLISAPQAQRPHTGQGKSLLLATFSLSEMPVEEREALEPAIASYGNVVLSWNSSFAGVDNEAWFPKFAERLAATHTIDCMRDPYMRGWYLFGRKR